MKESTLINNATIQLDDLAAFISPAKRPNVQFDSSTWRGVPPVKMLRIKRIFRD